MPLLTQVFGRNHTLALYETWQYSRLTNTPADTLHLTLHCCTKHQLVLFTIYNSPMNCLHFFLQNVKCTVWSVLMLSVQCTVYSMKLYSIRLRCSSQGQANLSRVSHRGFQPKHYPAIHALNPPSTAHSTTLHNIAEHCTKLHNTDPHWKHCTTLLNTMAHCPAMHPLNNKAQHYTTLYNQVQHNTAQ